MPFERSYLFLDTNVYVQEAYRFRGTSLGKLSDLSRDDELRLVVPEVTRREVASRLREAAEEHVLKIEAALYSKIVGLMSKTDMKQLGLDIELDREAVVNRVAGTWDSYCDACNAESIPIASIDLPEVLASYFEVKPPFEKGRKRHEFPDGFAVSSLRAFASENTGRPIYVVSKDKGLLAAFGDDSRFRCHKELSEIFDEYNRHTEALSPSAHKLVEDNAEWIADAVADHLAANPHLYASEYRENRIHIESATVDIEDVNLVEIGLGRAVFDIGVSYYVDAEVMDMVRVAYDDYDWDVVSRRFSGQITAYVEIISNDSFTELLEIASVEV